MPPHWVATPAHVLLGLHLDPAVSQLARQGSEYQVSQAAVLRASSQQRHVHSEEVHASDYAIDHHEYRIYMCCGGMICLAPVNL